MKPRHLFMRTVTCLVLCLVATLSGPASLGQGMAVAPRPLAAPAQANALNVELVGQVGGWCAAVAVQGRYAYLGVGPRLVVLDVSDPEQPVVVGQTAVLHGLVRDIALSGTLAYVAADQGGLRVVDVSDPAAPREAGFYDTPGRAEGVAVSGGLAYVADGLGLRVVDVANPAAPREVGFYNTPGSAYGVAVSGNHAYVADAWEGLLILRYMPELRYRVSLPAILK